MCVPQEPIEPENHDLTNPVLTSRLHVILAAPRVDRRRVAVAIRAKTPVILRAPHSRVESEALLDALADLKVLARGS